MLTHIGETVRRLLDNATRRAMKVAGQDLPMTYGEICNGVAESVCPVCDGVEALLAGPTGGMNMNVMCRHCGTRLNVAAWAGKVIIVEWTHGPQADIWGGGEPTRFPSPEQVAERKAIIDARGS